MTQGQLESKFKIELHNFLSENRDLFKSPQSLSKGVNELLTNFLEENNVTCNQFFIAGFCLETQSIRIETNDGEELTFNLK